MLLPVARPHCANRHVVHRPNVWVSLGLIKNFHKSVILYHPLRQLVRLIETKSSARRTFLANIKLAMAADSTVIVNVGIRNPA
jgi:hypothetical protein